MTRLASHTGCTFFFFFFHWQATFTLRLPTTPVFIEGPFRMEFTTLTQQQQQQQQNQPTNQRNKQTNSTRTRRARILTTPSLFPCLDIGLIIAFAAGHSSGHTICSSSKRTEKWLVNARQSYFVPLFVLSLGIGPPVSSHALPAYIFPAVPNKPHGFFRRKAPWKT